MFFAKIPKPFNSAETIVLKGFWLFIEVFLYACSEAFLTVLLTVSKTIPSEWVRNILMALTIAQLNAIKPKEKQFKVADEKGLYILAKPSGSLLWRFDYRFSGKRKTMSLGSYPELSLKEARKERDLARLKLDDGIDPQTEKKKEKLSEQSKDTFGYYLWRWFDKNRVNYTGRKVEKDTKSKIDRHIVPYLSDRRIEEITVKDIKHMLDTITSQGVYETATRMRGIVENVFNFAMLEEACVNNPAVAFRGYVKKPATKNFAFTDDINTIGQLLRDIDDYNGDPVTMSALKIQSLVFLRPINIVEAEWSQIDFKKKLWTIDAEKMKMRRKHVIPLSKQAIAVFKQLKEINGHVNYVFYSEKRQSHLHVETMRRALQSYLGYDGTKKVKMTTHGFRHMATTLLNNNKTAFGINHDIIEKQMAHEERNKVRAVYNHAEYLPERAKMMQIWADYLDELKQKAIDLL
ncbi:MULTISPECIES: tyrosine-type recombinase/integrase [Cysteiniphilum]|uniref:Integrase n=1 Tax=Cysteiniphilum litorale TaxID=2056700 RepID=A0A8J2Z5Y5_9GAMM|nr:MULTISPECIES: integrase arm-type DNA-binding domain-containing protein [Cysteiniphilum]GGG04050.1 integrase [Cysteiniphilum litorale]